MMSTLPEGTARVEERRGETNLSYSRQLSGAWSLQSSLGVEYSELTADGRRRADARVRAAEGLRVAGLEGR